ncbi:MAG TPA: PAS domain S-box protein, partial [Actinomycetota bacterium]|nr:PAS domain S-box protein [Actinomycetota bacterium]
MPHVTPALVDIEALLDPYALLRSIRDDSGTVVDFEFLAINQAGCKENGLERERTIGSTLLDVNPEDFETGLFDKYVAVVESGESLALDDWEYPMRSGEVRYYDISAVRIDDGIGVAWWDVTQRYARSRAVERAERELRATLDALLDPYNALIAVRDGSGEIIDFEYTHVNAASCRYLRKDTDELIGHRMSEVWSGVAADTVFAWAKHVLESGLPLTVDEQEVPLPTGEVRRFDVRGVAVGEVVSFAWRDVTDRVNTAREIAESRENYRLLAENASEMVFQTDVSGRVTWTSPSVTRVIGWMPADVMGRSMIEFVHPDDLAEVERELHDLSMQKVSSVRTEVRIATAEGSWRWVSVLGRALVDQKGQLTVGVGAMRDIQVQREAQVALEESEERFRRSMTDAAIGMALFSSDGRFLRVNAALCRLVGRGEPELMECTWQEITHPDDVARDTELLAGILAGRRDTYRLSKRCVRPDGEIVWVDLTVSCIRDEQGAVRHLMKQVVDITDNVRARQALASSEEHYRLMAENSSDVVFRASPEGQLEWISPSVTEVLGWMPDQLAGRRMFDYLHPDDFPQGLDLSPASEQRVEFEGRCRTSAGPYLWMDVSSRPLLDDAGRLIGRMGRLRDIQPQHDAQEALRVSERRFRTAMESAPTGMAVVGLHREFIQVNPALCRLLGRSEHWLLTHSLTDVLDPLDDDLDRSLRAQLLTGQAASLSRDHQMIRSDGQRLVVEQSTGLLCDDSGKATAYVSQFA